MTRFFLLLGCLLSSVAHAQVVAVQADKMNIFYIGIANPVTVAVEGYKEKDIALMAADCDIRPDGLGRSGHYNFWVSKPGMVKVDVIRRTKKGTIKIIDSVFFRVKRIPSPVAKLSGLTGGKIPQSLLMLQIAPSASLEGFDNCARYVIIRFTVVAYRGADEIFRTTTASPMGTRIDSITRDFFYSLKDNDRVVFQDIVAKGPDGTARTLEKAIEFTITDAHRYRRLRKEKTTEGIDPATGDTILVKSRYKLIR